MTKIKGIVVQKTILGSRYLRSTLYAEPDTRVTYCLVAVVAVLIM